MTLQLMKPDSMFINRISILLLIFFAMPSLAIGQNFKLDKKTKKFVFVDENDKEDNSRIFDDFKAFTNHLFAVKAKRKWRIMDSKGQFVGAPEYDDIHPWFGEYAIVKNAEKYGVIDTTLKEIIKYKYDYIDSYHPDSSLVLLDGKWGYLQGEDFVNASEPKYFRNPEVSIKTEGCRSSIWQCTNQALQKMIQKDMLYPQEAILKKVEGNVVADVYLDEEGRVDNVILVKGIGSGCEEEAVWAMKYYIEDIKPAAYHERPVKSIIRQTIKFKLSEKTVKAVDKYQKQKAKMIERRKLAKEKEMEKRKEREKDIEAKKEKEAAKAEEKSKEKEQ